jgi:protein-S-isoprenylcysteine O-methyltransferase Ste14
MRATGFEFRFRFFFILAIVLLGFWSPGLPTSSVWMLLAGWLAHQHWLTIQAASIAVGAVAFVCAAAAALLRTSASAWLGPEIVLSQQMHSDAVVANGPFRFVRNPLYLGLTLNVIALSVLMPLPGAIFAIVAVVIFLLRLTGAEEAELADTPGYRAYAARVPRLIPSLTPRVPASAAHANWGRGILGELYFWGAAISFAVLLPQYSALAISRGVLLSFGIGLVARGLLLRKPAPGEAA